MAQPGKSAIQVYGSTTPGAVPSAANMTTNANGVELAVNAADAKLFIKNTSGAVVEIGGGGGGGGVSSVTGTAPITATTVGSNVTVAFPTVGTMATQNSNDVAITGGNINAIDSFSVKYIPFKVSGDLQTPNITIGRSFLNQTTNIGVNNTIYGDDNLNLVTAASSRNIIVGNGNLSEVSGSAQNIIVGANNFKEAQGSNISDSIVVGSTCAFVSDPTVENSTYVGNGCFQNGESSMLDVFIGNAAGGNILRSLRNTFVGGNAGFGGNGFKIDPVLRDNTCVGYGSGTNLNSTQNTFIGSNAGLNQDGLFGKNTYIGYNSGSSCRNSQDQVIIGAYSGVGGDVGDITNGYGQVVISNGLGVPSAWWTGYAIDWKQSSGNPNWGTTSDVRLKKNITSIENGLDVITKLRPVNFQYDKDNEFGREYDENLRDGFIAQEYEEVLPRQVTKDEDGILSISQNLNPYLVNAIQEQQKMIEDLQQQVKELLAKLS